MKKSYIVDLSSAGMRIDRWLKNTLGKIPQSLIEKNLRQGKIKLNKKKIKGSKKLSINDKIDLHNLNIDKNFIQKKFKFEPTNKVIKETENLIIDNNQDFIVLNKKSGISVQGGTKSKKNLVDILSKSEIFKDTKPYSVHRLDKDTSGVFIMAKNRHTAQLLTSLFRLRKVHKTYLAICHGEINENRGEWNDDLLRYENGKKIIEKSQTIFNVIDKNNNSTFVKMRPITGRKHQLRKQLLNIGHSIYGDKKYKNLNYIKGINKDLMLHSYEIKFMINKKKFTYRALLPDYFKKLLITKRLNLSNLK